MHGLGLEQAVRAVLLLLLLSGCLGPAVEPGPPPSVDPESERLVVAQDFTFKPADLNISVGEAVTWVNRDDVDHWIAAEDNDFNSGRLPPEARFSWTFNQTATYPYRCMIHPGMVGSIHVS